MEDKATTVITALTIVVSIFCSIKADAREYHVSAEFKGGEDGSETKPFRTISSAAKVVKPGDTCIVHKGVYRETVTPKRSGTKGNPIVFRADPKGSATIVGSDPVTGWKKHSGHIYKATMNWSLGKNNQVFVDGRVMQEARWPNDLDGDPMTPDGVKIVDGSLKHLLCPAFPAEWQRNDLQGAVVWVLTGAQWNSWTSVVTSYDPKAKKVSFPMPKGMGKASAHSPGGNRKGTFYLVGALKLLDAPGEWFYNEKSKELYLWAPDNADPNTLRVEAKSRLMGLALTGRSWITVDGINLQGCTIGLEKAGHCTVRNSKALYISHTRGGQTLRLINEKSGIYIGGRHNRIESCEIAYSAGNGISLLGTDNAVVNCWIHHVDYIGAYCAPVDMAGMRHLISHNTIEYTARDCIVLGGAEHLIQYNDVGFSGQICNDMGVIYRGAIDGGNTRIRYNFVHDNQNEHNRAGIYLDNWSKNFIIHNNVVWNTGDGVRLNLPTGFNMVLNNTLFGRIRNAYSPWTGQYRAWGTHAMNNLVIGTAEMYPEVVFRANILLKDLSGVFDFDKQTYKGNSPGKGKGIPIPDITPREQVDVGAWQHGSPTWKVGHDFKNPPAPEYTPASEFLRNYIRNAAFEYPRYHPEDEAVDPFVHWISKGVVTVEFNNGFKSAISRNTVQGNSLALGGETDSGVEQKILTLTPETEYYFSGYARHGEGVKNVVFAVELGERVIAEKASSDVKLEDGQAWRHVRLRFKTGPNDKEATVMITKKGAGKAYIDDTGVVPAAFYAQSEEWKLPTKRSAASR